MRGRYGHDRPVTELAGESGALLQAWRDIDVLIERLNEMQRMLRDQELAADDRRPTSPMAIPAAKQIDPADFTETITLQPGALALPPPPPLPDPPVRARVYLDAAVSAVSTTFAANRARDAYSLEGAVLRALDWLPRI